MKTQRTTNHLAKGAAALLALLISFGSFAAAASAFEPQPFEPPTVPGLDELAVPGICELIDCDPIVPGDDDDEPGDDEPGDDEPGDDEPGDDEPGDDEPGDEDEDEPVEEEEEPEVEVEDETEEDIDTPVEATPTFTG